MRLIRTNFNPAVGINTGILGGAIMGWRSPVVSILLHNGNTIGTLLNALAGGGRSLGRDDGSVYERLEDLRKAL